MNMMSEEEGLEPAFLMIEMERFKNTLNTSQIQVL